MSRASERSASIANPPNVPLDALTSLRFFAARRRILSFRRRFRYEFPIAPTIVENILNNGWLGVPFFFILSGFILTYAHADMNFNHSQLRRFFVARFSRLYPVYMLTILFCIPFVDHFSFATDWFQFLLLQTWFPNSGATDWNFVAWTLSVEMLFYLVFPFAFVFFRRLSNRALLCGLCVAIGLLLLIWLNMTPGSAMGKCRPTDLNFAFPCRFCACRSLSMG